MLHSLVAFTAGADESFVWLRAGVLGVCTQQQFFEKCDKMSSSALHKQLSQLKFLGNRQQDGLTCSPTSADSASGCTSSLTGSLCHAVSPFGRHQALPSVKLLYVTPEQLVKSK